MLSACSEAFLDSMSEGGYNETVFYGHIKEVRTVYYIGSAKSNSASGALLGGIIGGMAGAGLSNGSGVGILVGAGAGATIGGAAGSVKDSDFSENASGKRATKLVIRKDNGDIVVIVQRFTRAFMPGDSVRVSVFGDGSVGIRRVMEERRSYDDDVDYYRRSKHHHHHNYDD
ncbi:hypothetical protein [Candidatus Ichthyocystis sparus]|uniref:hypothetical protein n=1 Tax=Candidatus Ichthyocystis sparus TaxID=1561004 RepID=UPI0011465A57|nr:hypothetical protein [Candidatus Ichthyocystis sparus]